MPNFSGIWTERQQMQVQGAGTWPENPGAPTIGTATVAGPTSASVGFTAPSNTGYPAGIISYTVTSSPGGITATGASSPITVTGLTTDTAYTFTVAATNASGTGPSSAASNSVTPTIPNYIEEVFSTYLYTGNGSVTTVNNGIALGSSLSPSLQGLPIGVISGNFASPYVLTYVNDGLAPSNNSNFTYSNTSFDIYVIFPNAVTITEYLLAPQGSSSNPYNTPTGFNVLASNDGSTWTTITSVTSISNGYPDWNPGTYRTFSFSNSTAYKYWRLQITGSGSGSVGNSVAEWRITGTATTTTKGGLAWIKSRNNATSNALFDTSRGVNKYLSSNSTGPQDEYGAFTNMLTAFNANGFSLGADASTAWVNYSGYTYASWTFAEQPKFFDVVTYTGTGATQTISHNLQSTPGCIMIKKTSATQDWLVYHRGLTGGLGASGGACYVINLNTTSAQGNQGSAGPTANSTSVTLSTNWENDNGATYVMYLFAHDAGGFGLTGTDNVISCGSYTGNGSTAGPSATLGYEPQWVMIKESTATNNWTIVDNMRNGLNQTAGYYLVPNLSDAEATVGVPTVVPSATGFSIATDSTYLNASGQTYIYIAIRRGPMKVPDSGGSVFAPVTLYGNSSGFYDPAVNADLAIVKYQAGTQGWWWTDRLRGNGLTIDSATSGAEASNGYITIAGQPNVQITTTFANGNSNATWNFQRAPSFFDEVCYVGTGSANRTVTHNLGVTPELAIFKNRTTNGYNWVVKNTATFGTNNYLILEGSYGYLNNAAYGATATASQLTLSTGGSNAGDWNQSGANIVAYLFATCAGVSKVGSYTGTGALATINCGFTGGARFVMIKRTDSSANWFMWDTSRGMVAGTDPSLSLNTTAAEANANSVYTVTTGFQLLASPSADVNTNGGSYIYLAIA